MCIRDRLESILESLTKSKIKAVLLGAGVTAIIQSSSATTVMAVSYTHLGVEPQRFSLSFPPFYAPALFDFTRRNYNNHVLR